MVKARLPGKTNQCLQQLCLMATRCIRLVVRSMSMNKELWQTHKTQANMEEGVDLDDQVTNKQMDPEAWMEWFTKHSWKVISWRQQTFIPNLKRKETCMKTDCMLKQVSIKQNFQRSKNNMITRWKIIQMKCTESTTNLQSASMRTTWGKHKWARPMDSLA